MKLLPIKTLHLSASIAVTAISFSPCISAQTDSKQSQAFFDIFAGIEFRQAGNANRTSQSNAEIDELQTRTNISVFGAYNGDIISHAQADYTVRHESFAENTQEDDSTLNGELSVLLGDATKNYDLSLTHSSRTLLVDPEEADLTSNRDDRNIFTAIGTLRTSPAKPNIFSAGVSSTKTKFNEFVINDSTRDGINTSYTRRVDPLTSAGIDFSVTDIDFDAGNNADFEYKRASIFFRRNLRRLNYNVNIGRYETKNSSGNEDSGPFSSLNAGYSTTLIQFSLTAERDITDTSQGNNNNELFSGDNSVDGRIGTQDQILRKYFSASLSFNSLCANCTALIETGKEDEDFFNLTEESSESDFIRASMSFKPASNITLALSANRNDFSFTQRIDANNFTNTLVRASVEISNLARNLNSSLFIESLKRDFDQRGDYKSLSYGIRFDYQIY